MEKMASRISSTPRTNRSAHRAYTLVEVVVASTLAALVFVAVLKSYVMMARTGANIQNYTLLEAKARKGLEMFSREARMAYSVTSGSSSSVTLTIPDTSSSRTGTGTGAYTVTYFFDTSDPTNGTFKRTGPPIDDPTGTSATTILASGVKTISGSTPFLNYYRYVTGGGYATGFATNTASTLTEVKQIEISFLLQLQTSTVTAATNKVLSARFILRNK